MKVTKTLKVIVSLIAVVGVSLYFALGFPKEGFRLRGVDREDL
jgi:hypothetical protein